MITPFFESPQVTLYQGDCLELMPRLPDNSIDFILTDLPYGITECKWDNKIPLEKLWEQFERLIKPKKAIALFAVQPFTSELVISNRKWFKYEWIWEKSKATGYLDCRRKPMRAHENICIFSNGASIYNPQISPKPPENIRPPSRGRASKVYGAKNPNAPRTIDTALTFPKSIIRFNNETGLHPTQKPVSLLKYLISTYTCEGDTVLDCTSGSGSTLVAAQDIGRKSIGIEIDAGYCQIAVGRCRQLNLLGGGA